MITNDFENSIKRISLKTGDGIVGYYRKLQTDACGSKVILELTSGNEVEVSFSKGSIEEGIIRKALCRVKRGVKMGIRKLDDPKIPITVEKFLNKRAKKLTLYVTVDTGKRLEKLQEPGKKLLTAIVKALDIVEGRETIVAVVSQGHIRCNKMQNIGKPDRFNCSMLGAPVSEEYCLEKCIVADQLKILGKTEVIHLFPVRKQNTISPKNEHLRTPPRNEQDLCGSCWKCGEFLGTSSGCSKTVIYP